MARMKTYDDRDLSNTHFVRLEASGFSLFDLVGYEAVLIAGINAVEKVVVVAAWANPWVCGFLIVVVAIGAFYYIYKLTNESPSYVPGSFVPTCGLTANFSPQFHSEYTATPDCDITWQLEAKLPEGKWTHICSATADILFHHIHHFRNGTTRGIRTSQSSASVASDIYPTKNNRRSPYDREEDARMIGGFYWTATNVAAYDSLHSTSSTTNNAATDMNTLMGGGNWIEVCLDSMDNKQCCFGFWKLRYGLNNKSFDFSSQTALKNQWAVCEVGEVYYQWEPQPHDNL